MFFFFLGRIWGSEKCMLWAGVVRGNHRVFVGRDGMWQERKSCLVGPIQPNKSSQRLVGRFWLVWPSLLWSLPPFPHPGIALSLPFQSCLTILALPLSFIVVFFFFFSNHFSRLAVTFQIFAIPRGPYDSACSTNNSCCLRSLFCARICSTKEDISTDIFPFFFFWWLKRSCLFCLLWIILIYVLELSSFLNLLTLDF